MLDVIMGPLPSFYGPKAGNPTHDPNLRFVGEKLRLRGHTAGGKR